jgi:hypothetical protein
VGIGSWRRRGLGLTDIPGSTTVNLGRSILYGRHDIGEAPGTRSSLMSCVVSLNPGYFRDNANISTDWYPGRLHPGRIVGSAKQVRP